MPFYLIHLDTFSCVNFQAIIGLTTTKNGIMEILYNYHKEYYHQVSNLTFEDSHYKIQLFSITEEDYDYLEHQFTNNRDLIEDNYQVNKYIPECQQSTYLSVILYNDLPNYSIFNKQFHKKYFDIIRHSEEII